MDFNSIADKLLLFHIDEQLTQKAHSEIAPYRNSTISDIQILNAKKAGVLLLVHPNNDKAHFTLIERSSYDGVHSRQISLPGGKVENQDIDISATALREAHEEVNINPKDVEIISQLSNIYVPPSNFYITPILGLSRKRPDYIPEKKEVNKILEIPILDLLSLNVLQQTKVTISKNMSFPTPYLNLQDKVVWGATAIILNELRHFLK
ncbi:MAG: 8-oxo-dGTP pyrophosphatase MutT (NUDIX family) [Saprospiraceae bacterium]|jgi:8-oxo-dGTP pyrophosphatase MutT (NUDIX family)